MSQDRTANFYTFTDHHGTTQISYYPHAPGPIIQGQSSGPRLQYEGPEGSFVYPQAGPGREDMNVQQDSVLAPHINVELVPTIDDKAVSLTLLLPPINIACHEHVDVHSTASQANTK